MSDTDDLGSYGPTTPFVKKKQPRAGPSRKNKASDKQHSSRSPDVVEVTDDTMEVDEDDAIRGNKRKVAPSKQADKNDRPPPSKRRAAPLSKQANSTKAKGKAKATDKPDTTKYKQTSSTPITVDESGDETPTNVKEPSPPVKRSSLAPKSTLTVASSTHDKQHIRELEKTNEQYERTTARLTKELDAARLACEQLTKQFEELSRIRLTEPEILLQQLQEQHDASITAQDLLVEELKTQLSVVEPFKQLGNSRTLDYVKREDVEKANKGLQQRLEKSEKSLAAKEAQILELQQLEKTLRMDLQNEISHSKTLVKPVKGGRHDAINMTSSDSKKYAASLRFYEDLTNLLIPNVKFHDSVIPDRRDTTFSCVYSAETAEDDEPVPALNFTLKFCAEVEEGHQLPVTPEAPFTEIISYNPLNLELESEAFAEKLKFLGSAFSFKKEQLPLFLRELHKQMNPEEDNENENTNDVSGDMKSKEAINVDSD